MIAATFLGKSLQWTFLLYASAGVASTVNVPRQIAAVDELLQFRARGRSMSVRRDFSVWFPKSRFFTMQVCACGADGGGSSTNDLETSSLCWPERSGDAHGKLQCAGLGPNL